MKRWIKYSYLSAVYLFLYFPVGVLVLYSFNQSSLSTQWQGFTWQWYQSLFFNYKLIRVTLNSFFLGISAATSATCLGTLAAFSLYRYHFFGKQILYLLAFVMVISPEIVMAIALLLFFSWLHLPGGFISLLLAHMAFCMPFVTITVYGRLIGIDKNIFEAAKDLGANEFTIFRRLFIPLLGPAILSGWLLSFTLSLDDVIISFFLSGPEFPLLPLEIYSWVRLGIKPELNALCSVLLSLTLSLVLVSQLLLRNRRD